MDVIKWAAKTIIGCAIGFIAGVMLTKLLVVAGISIAAISVAGKILVAVGTIGFIACIIAMIKLNR